RARAHGEKQRDPSILARTRTRSNFFCYPPSGCHREARAAPLCPDLRDVIRRLHFKTALNFRILDFIDLGTFYRLRITHNSLFQYWIINLLWDYCTIHDGKTAWILLIPRNRMIWNRMVWNLISIPDVPEWPVKTERLK
ncbi:hypothetical protein PDJAM_G00005000, partial [Pangasius djambal]|nr:hypothetical protein [Pangasius djambal]